MLSFISATFLGTILASANAGRVWRDLAHDVKHLYTYDDFVVEFQKEQSAGTSIQKVYVREGVQPSHAHCLTMLGCRRTHPVSTLTEQQHPPPNYSIYHLSFLFFSSIAAELRFGTKLKAIHAHNAKGLSWREGVNKFTDMTESEFAMYVNHLNALGLHVGEGDGVDCSYVAHSMSSAEGVACYMPSMLTCARTV